MKKRMFLVLLIVLISLVLTACAQKSPAGAIPVLVNKDSQPGQIITANVSQGPVPEVYAQAARVRYCLKDFCLILEFLEDGLLHGEYAEASGQHDLGTPISVSPMVYKMDYAGPAHFSILEDGSLLTDALKVNVDKDLCFSVTDTRREPDWQMGSLCPKDLKGFRKHLTIDSPDITDIYGLGEQFITTGVMDGNWMGKTRYPGVDQGNAMTSFGNAMTGNAQFSIAYFLGKGLLNYGLFIDNPMVQTWNFRDQPWDINVSGNSIRFYLFSGENLAELRQGYVTLTGTPPVPPKKMFGLWVSEYGYDNWAEMEDKLASLRKNRFPVDGFVLDLQWFGGITSNSETSRMGSMDWDTKNFPDPAGHIAKYAADGIGIMTISEPYISAGLPEHKTLADKGYLAKQTENGKPVYLEANPWWGKGGMLDYSNQAGTDFLFDWKYKPLLDIGVQGLWTDLGEPEAFEASAWYAGTNDEYGGGNTQYDVHNLYNFLWSKSIYDGMLRSGMTLRPFILSRSGAPGSQRFGVAMWSGDIGSNLDSLAAHFQVQGQMSLSGMDYFGSDAGGFNQYALVGDIDSVYTPWFAASAMLDVPVRPHTQNLCNCNETAPDRVGYVESNLANIRLRYELSPYLYSLAHRAYLYGEAVFPPLVYAYQEDENVRQTGGEKMIGSELLAVFSAKLFQEYVDVYLPAGVWVNYHTHERITSKGESFTKVPLVWGAYWQLPLYLRAGAIVPVMYVDDQTLDITGRRADGSRRDELMLRIVPTAEGSEFTLYEDDEVSTAYQHGEVRTTLISQKLDKKRVTVTIAAAEGTVEGAIAERNNELILELDNPGWPAKVTVNGTVLKQVQSALDLDAVDSGWFQVSTGTLMVKTGVFSVTQEKVVRVNY